MIPSSVKNNTEIKLNSKNLYQLSFKDLNEEQIKKILAKVEEICTTD